MISKIKEVIKKLEFGIVEFFVGALMVIGLIGYFASVTADLDWIDHTVSFVLFSYLFYKLNITSILFGKTSKFANFIIIVSYFSLFFKDVISYTKIDAFKFKIITFIDYFYLFFSNNIFLTNIASFYLGIAGIFIISVYLTKKIKISHPSFLYAVYQRELKNNLEKFLSIFVLLLGFYYFIYNIILEWLEFVIDDPVIAAGIVLYVYSIAKHHKKFHSNNFIFKIGNFSAAWYARFVSLFHYKKTLPLAISGLLILHALSDLGVFAYSLTFMKENFYLEFLKDEHVPFLKLFSGDIKNVSSSAAIPLFIDYLLNALSLVILLLIPIIVWIKMFSHREFHFNRVFLFFIYSSVVAYMLLPGYVIRPLTGSSITGVDIYSIPLSESKSILDNFFANKSEIIIAVALISVIMGLVIYILSSNSKIKNELYALSIIGGLTFYTIYLYYFFSSLLVYFYNNILLTITTKHFLIGIVLSIFLVLSIMFYILGYLMFLYEIVMEYHKRKWSDPIDEELVIAIKSIEKRIIKAKKAQIIGELFKYLLVGAASIVLLVGGYAMVNLVREKACNAEITKFEIDLRNLDKSLRFGTKEQQSHDVPCNADKIYFFDLNKEINYNEFKNIPIIKDSLENKVSKNVFLVKDGKVKSSFYAGDMELLYPYYICFKPKSDKISFFAEGAGKSVKVGGACNQPECTLIPINISKEDAADIIEEAIEFGCPNCPINSETELQNFDLTKDKIELFRKFSFCNGITTVEITIKPKEDLKNITFYELIPKDCVDDLNKYLVENIGENVAIKADPLIMWFFDDLSEEKIVSYQLDKLLSEECMQLISGFGISQFIEAEAEEEEEIEEEIPEEVKNTAPAISGLPDETLSDIGLKENVISNLMQYAEDAETKEQDLAYTITAQTNQGLVDCDIDVEKHVDCEVKKNENGFSDVTVQVSDGELSDEDIFRVSVEYEEIEQPVIQCQNTDASCGAYPNCQNCDLLNFYSANYCSGNNVYNNLNDYKCSNNVCVPLTTPKLVQSCANGNCQSNKCVCKSTITSCGSYPSCYTCQTDYYSGNYCSGSDLYKDFYDYSCSNNLCIFATAQQLVQSCGSGSYNDCTGYGDWTCKDLNTKIRSRTCYTKGCSGSSCYSTPWTDNQEEACQIGDECIENECIYVPPPSPGGGDG